MTTLLVVVSILTAACAPVASVGDRGDVLRRIVLSTVQLRAELPGGVRRSASGVVIASDAGSRQSWIITTLHVLGSSADPQVSIRTTATAARLKAVVVARNVDTDLALLCYHGCRCANGY